jgi:hypothetical protein
MNTGMQDGINLAWKLAMVRHGAADADLLLSYSPERSAVGEMVLRNASRMTEMATLANPAAQGLRNLVLRFALGLAPIRERLVLQMSEIEIAYGKSPLSRGLHAGAHGLEAGARLPPEFYAGAPPGAASRPRFVLYAEQGAGSADLLERFPELLESEARPTPEGGLILLVRPDGYIGFAGKAGDWAQAVGYLGGLAA